MSDTEKEIKKVDKKSTKKRSATSIDATAEQVPASALTTDAPGVADVADAADGVQMQTDKKPDDTAASATGVEGLEALGGGGSDKEGSVEAVGAGSDPCESVSKKAKTETLKKGHSVQDINRIVVSSGLAAMDKVEMKSRPESHLLVLITNDVSWKAKGGGDKDSVSTSTAMNYVVLKVLDSVGFNKAPYEKVDGANPKHLVYFDKGGRLIEKNGKGAAGNVKNVTLASIGKVGDSKVLDCRSFEPHPTGSMRTKWRGVATGIVGVISPGVPMVGYIFDDQKESTMKEADTFERLKPFTVAIIGVSARPLEQCKVGYGIKLSTVKIVEDLNITSIPGMLPMPKFFYHDKRAVGDQTEERLAIKDRVEVFESDLAFIAKNIRSSAVGVSEKPVVFINLRSVEGGKHSHKVHIQSNNTVMELEFCNLAGAEASIYHGIRFRVHIPQHMFTISETGLAWIQLYYQWLLDSNSCDLMIIHDQWHYDKMKEGSGSVSMHCCIIPDEKFITGMDHQALPLAADLQLALNTPTGTMHEPLDISGEVDKYTAWSVANGNVSNTKKSYAVLLDVSKIYTIKPIDADETDSKMQEEEEQCDENDDVEAVAQVTVAGDKDIVVADISKPDKTAKKNIHTSLVCRVYPGMDVDRKVSCAFLMTRDVASGKIDCLIPIGIKAKPTYKYANAASMAAAGSILENPKNLLQ